MSLHAKTNVVLVMPQFSCHSAFFGPVVPMSAAGYHLCGSRGSAYWLILAGAETCPHGKKLIPAWQEHGTSMDRAGLVPCKAMKKEHYKSMARAWEPHGKAWLVHGKSIGRAGQESGKLTKIEIREGIERAWKQHVQSMARTCY